jgi:osmoprotectant transport system ATP-binding protein
VVEDVRFEATALADTPSTSLSASVRAIGETLRLASLRPRAASAALRDAQPVAPALPARRDEARQRTGAQVEYRRVTKQYGPGAAAVDDLSLVVAPGEVCVLVGPSGCGKTTTLKMANRLIEPTGGQVLIDGTVVSAVDVIALRRRTGYVIQHVGLFPHQTVAENVAAVPRLLGWRRDRINSRVDELLTLVGLDPALVRQRYPAQLSGGERQRVGVARALAAEPPLLLMDEPFGAVDPITRRHLQDEFLRLQRRLGTTILLVTHDIDEAIVLGDRLAVMRRGGHLAQYARPVELLAAPADDFVAQFVGADRAYKLLGLLTVADARLDRAAPPSPEPAVLRPDTTLREALAYLLTTPGRAGAVADGAGVLTLDSIGEALRAAVSVARAEAA